MSCDYNLAAISPINQKNLAVDEYNNNFNIRLFGKKHRLGCHTATHYNTCIDNN